MAVKILVNTWTEVDAVTSALKAGVAAGDRLSENSFTDAYKQTVDDLDTSAVLSDEVRIIKKLTQAEYDAIVTKSDITMYIIIG